MGRIWDFVQFLIIMIGFAFMIILLRIMGIKYFD